MSLTAASMIALSLILAVACLAVQVAYNLFLHPLRHFPGPLGMRATRMTFCYKLIKGTLPFEMLDFHNEYGEVVRIAPNELSFSNPQAWKDIMGHRKQGDPIFEKYEGFYRPFPGKPTDIVSSSGEEHSILRRQLAHGFSERSTHEQQPTVMRYVDLLIQRLHQNCAAGTKAVNLGAWYNYATFDIIGDLAFGEPFGCLDNSDYHPWIRTIFQMARVGTVVQTASYFPTLRQIIMACFSTRAGRRRREQHLEMTKSKLLKRMEATKLTGRPDFIEGLLKVKDDLGIPLENLEANSSILIIAGSETTATLLGGLTYFLLTNPEHLKTLTDEIRSSFKNESEIDINSTNKLRYLRACLNEALRLYPPVALGLPRMVPNGGANICGHFVPDKTIVAIHQWAMYHSENHFHDPFKFHPERFLDDPRFVDDNKNAFQPFHIGPRNCLGKNVAYVEMRLIMSRVLWNFDLRIADSSRDWLERQKIYMLWDKGPLYAYLSPSKTDRDEIT